MHNPRYWLMTLGFTGLVSLVYADTADSGNHSPVLTPAAPAASKVPEPPRPPLAPPSVLNAPVSQPLLPSQRLDINEHIAASVLADQVDNTSSHYQGGIYRLPYWVETVASICPWRSSDDDGVIRLIRTREEWGKGLYLQWMSHRLAQHKGRPMLASIRVYEIGPQMPLDFPLPEWQLMPDQCYLTAEARMPDGQRYAMRLAIMGLGQYQLALVPVAKPVPEMVLPATGEVTAISPDSSDPDECAGDPCPDASADSQSRTARGPRAGTALHYK